MGAEGVAMTKSESKIIRAARAQLRQRLKAVSVERNKLRALRDDLDDLMMSCDDAAKGLEAAIEALSRYA